MPLILDVSDAASVAAAAAAAGDVSILVNNAGIALGAQGTTVTALHVGYMDTDMAAKVDAPKADPREIARATADAIADGQTEVLADEVTRAVKAGLASPLATA